MVESQGLRRILVFGPKRKEGTGQRNCTVKNFIICGFL
jgi:hypothetical protein